MTLAESCYSKMFSYCTSLTTAPILPAMTLATNCYESMFYGCTSLTTVPTLPAMTLATNCYKSMFYGCSSLTTAPTLPALGLANYCYEQMFYSCTQLNYVKCLANDRDLINDGLTTGGWLHGVAPTGTFVKLNGAEWSIPGADGIPEGWDVENADVFTFIGDGGSGPWFDGSSWSNYEMPAEGSDVIIQAQAFIDGGTAIAGDVYLYGGGITIEESGQFIHTNSVKVTLQKWTTGFGNNSSAKNGWYTIASPFTESFTPSEDMLSGVYDLYYYDEAHAKWCNYKQEGDHYHFNIEPRKGYLYANSDPQNLSFTGWTPATNATFAVPLSYTATAGNLKGFNLVGNPFSCNVTGNVALGGEALTMYYIVDGGSELYAAALSERAIKPCEGFFVQATGADQQLVFNPATTRRETPAQPAYIRIEAGNDSFMDRAYVQFDSGNTLRKMSLCDDTPKVYVMHDGKDYAAATIGRDAPWQVSTLPVHFEAAENGTYTINVNVENVDLDYLHLVDNMTGADVDLLASDGGDAINRVSTYRFEAKTTDYASRFKLVFSLGDADEDNDGDNGEPFAYYNGSEWVIANGENATLQVVDVMGCIVICRDAARHVSTNGLAPGVYVLRLIDGESVRTQKIFVE